MADQDDMERCECGHAAWEHDDAQEGKCGACECRRFRPWEPEFEPEEVKP